MFIGFSLSPNPVKPEITYGEFPFKLKYEIDRNKVVVEDTLICEYDGIGISEGKGISSKVLERICIAFDCQLGDVMEYEREDKNK